MLLYQKPMDHIHQKVILFLKAGPKISDNAQETLKHFCRWQHGMNDADDDSINHHDVAILLTR